jgi:hypothetical protein
MGVNTIVAAQPDRKNALPWFGKVVQLIGTDQVEILWLHKSNNMAKYYYLDDKTSTVHREAIICNGVEFEPVFRAQLLWKLLTPLSFIQELNQVQPPNLAHPLATTTFVQKAQAFDITNLVFNDAEEFEDFLYSAKCSLQNK